MNKHMLFFGLELVLLALNIVTLLIFANNTVLAGYFWLLAMQVLLSLVLGVVLLFLGAVLRLVFHRPILYFLPIALMIFAIGALLIWPNIVAFDEGSVILIAFLINIGFGILYATPFGFLYPSTQTIAFTPHSSLHDIMHDDQYK